MAKSSSGIKGILALIAGIVLIFFGVMGLIGSAFAESVGGFVGGVLGSILEIILGVVILMASGVITDKLGIPYNTITCLIFTILTFFIGGWIPFICMLIALILFIIGK